MLYIICKVKFTLTPLDYCKAFTYDYVVMISSIKNNLVLSSYRHFWTYHILGRFDVAK